MVLVYQTQTEIETRHYGEFQNITKVLEDELRKSRIYSGILCVNVLHTTAAVAIQEPDPTVHEDGRETLNKIVPTDRHYHHNYEGNINGAAHQKQMLVGACLTIPIGDGKLVLGTWQGVFLIELFQPMRRRIFITIIGDRNGQN
jgi:secondary thiamine-phosphate synthase enzyme